jgi:hypothetical protein
LPFGLTAEDLRIYVEASFVGERDRDFALESPAMGVVVALERARDLVAEEAAEPAVGFTAEERDIADPRDCLEFADTRLAAVFR